MLLIALLLEVAPATQSPCWNAGSDLEISQCWDRADQAADAELNKIWPDVLKSAREADRDFMPTQRRETPAAVQDLISAQRAWLKYRDAQCALESDYAQGGSLEPILSAKCSTEMTRARIMQLHDIAAGFRE